MSTISVRIDETLVDAARTAAHEIVTEWRWHNHLPFNQAIRQTRPD